MAMISETETGEALADANIKQMIGRDVLKGRVYVAVGWSLILSGEYCWPQIVCRRSTIPTMAFGCTFLFTH